MISKLPRGSLWLFLSIKFYWNQPCSFLYVLFMADFIWQQKSYVVTMNSVFPAKSKIFTLWSFKENFAGYWCECIHTYLLHDRWERFYFCFILIFSFSSACFLCNILHVKIQRGPHRSLCYWLMSMKNINTYLPQEITEEGWVCNNEKINRKSCMPFFGKYSFIKYMLGAFLIFWKIISLIAIFNLFIGATYTQNKIHSSQDLCFVALNIPTLLGTYHHHSSREPSHSPQLKFCIHYIPISHFLPTTLDNSICLYEPNHPRYSHTSGMLQHLTFCDWPPP